MQYTVYSKPQCPQCDVAKSLLSKVGYDYREVILDVGQVKNEGVEYISREDLINKIPPSGNRSMPQIFKQDHTSAMYVGGYQDLVKDIRK